MVPQASADLARGGGGAGWGGGELPLLKEGRAGRQSGGKAGSREVQHAGRQAVGKAGRQAGR